MKLNVVKLIIATLIIHFFINCSIGTRTDACKADLRRATVLEPSDDSCEMLQTVAGLPLRSNATEEMIQSRMETLSFLILNCYQYYTKLKECENEGNRYTPALYSRE
ncbi:hypothetical protein [Leptospira interrogans]|uniref:hypothetical protein n=1 Tax=Leptospira interrogans TaxID=173 RepID=UPI0004A2A56B|nr:hypothetical protein [Leptospira interrogans]WOT13259.1 hypothetical protein CFY92_0020955 [Leptospira interrogans]